MKNSKEEKIVRISIDNILKLINILILSIKHLHNIYIRKVIKKSRLCYNQKQSSRGAL